MSAVTASSAQALLAFDFGTKRLGVASGSRFTGQGTPLKTLTETGPARFDAIERLLKEWQPEALVVGVPFHPDGAEHEVTQQARRFARQLAGRFRLPVFEVDERYTSVEAEAQGSRGAALDAAAAALIAEQFFRENP